MSDLDKHRAEREARDRRTDLGRSTRYRDALDRYLQVTTHRTGDSTPARAGRPPVSPANGLVLVGADDTATSCMAVDQAAIEAELRGAELRIVHVRHPLRPGRDDGAPLLDRLTVRVRTSLPTVPVSSRLTAGTVASLLLTEARQASLLVVGHRHGPTGTMIGLSVADRLAGLHPGVILVVRMPGWPPGPGFGDRPIGVGVEHAGVFTPALQFALAEARLRGCELVVLRAGKKLAPSSRRETLDGVTVHHRTVDADPAKALARLSEKAAAVVVGRRGTGAHPVTMLGSVSRAVVRQAACPVFLV